MVNSSFSPIIECANCGTRDKWTFEQRAGVTVKIMPKGWSHIPNTYSGDVYFHSASCEKVWCKRDYKAPDPIAVVAAAKAEEVDPSDPRKFICQCGLSVNRRGRYGHMKSVNHQRRMAGREVGVA